MLIKIRYLFIALGMLLCFGTSAEVGVSIGIGTPHVSIGINVPAYPRLVSIPHHPVYYAPQLQINFFFFDGMYWVYQDDAWYASYWYNGPWWLIDPRDVPVVILHVPVRYYRHPPEYFRSWSPDFPPRWGEHWGHDWEQSRSGWEHWNYGNAPSRAPRPYYQRKFYGEHYPQQLERQQELHQKNYRYQPRDPVVRQHYQEHGMQRNHGPKGVK